MLYFILELLYLHVVSYVELPTPMILAGVRRAEMFCQTFTSSLSCFWSFIKAIL